MQRLSGANTSVRSLIVSQTGMGKSMYMRMTALCLARRELEADGRIGALSRDAGLPDDMYVLYVPAYMFSYCYQKPEYRAWTDDFVKLYFNCMLRLAPAINFDRHEVRDSRITPEAAGYALDHRLLRYILLIPLTRSFPVRCGRPTSRRCGRSERPIAASPRQSAPTFS